MRILPTLILLAFALPALAVGPLNDTGITWSGDATSGNADTCDDAHPAGQDCFYGADAAAAAGVRYKVGGSAGTNGFDFTKVCMSGEAAGEGDCPADPPLGDGPNDWACTRDNVTGLVWELKVDDDTHLRHQNHHYTWYDTNTPDGNAGETGDTTTCNNTLGGENCNTENYTAAVNLLTVADRLCGATDWRMPTVKELEGIADFGRVDPAIDPTYFPNTPSEDFWTGSPRAYDLDEAWYVYFYSGNSDHSDRYHQNLVRLVRGGQ
jgi:hypothetical protein